MNRREEGKQLSAGRGCTLLAGQRGVSTMYCPASMVMVVMDGDVVIVVKSQRGSAKEEEYSLYANMEIPT